MQTEQASVANSSDVIEMIRSLERRKISPCTQQRVASLGIVYGVPNVSYIQKAAILERDPAMTKLLKEFAAANRPS